LADFAAKCIYHIPRGLAINSKASDNQATFFYFARQGRLFLCTYRKQVFKLFPKKMIAILRKNALVINHSHVLQNMDNRMLKKATLHALSAKFSINQSTTSTPHNWKFYAPCFSSFFTSL